MIPSSHIVLQPFGTQREQFHDLIQERGFGIEVVDFAMPDILNDDGLFQEHLTAQIEELRDFNGVKSLHGPFVDIIPHSGDARVAALAEERVRAALEVAERLNCSPVVFHTGINVLIRNPGYLDRILGIQAEFWNKMLGEFPSLSICLENMWEQEASTFVTLMEKTGHPRLNVCFDSGHANVFSEQEPASWVEDLGTFLTYMHWNDNEGDNDSELALGRGTIAWTDLIAEILKMERVPRIVLEVGSVQNVEESLSFLSRLEALDSHS